MKVVIVGAGSIGTRHAGILKRRLQPEILVVEPDLERRQRLVQELGARGFADLPEALNESPQAAFICSPTSMHVPHALAALRAGCHVFLEKPLSTDLEGVDRLEEEAQLRRRVVLVACNFRFDPAMRQLKSWLDAGAIGRPLVANASYGQHLPSCRPGRDYRSVYSARKELGGGILLDSVHEIDYLCWLLGDVESVSAMLGKLSDLELDVEDTADILLRFRSGVMAQIHLDYLRPEYNRSCEITGSEGVLQWCYQERAARCFSAGTGSWTPAAAPALAGDMYDAQVEHFLACLAGSGRPAQAIADAVKIMRVVMAVRLATEKRQEISLGSRETAVGTEALQPER